MNLLDVLMGSMTSQESLEAMSQKTGATAEQTKKLVAEALPVMMKSMTDNAAKSEENAKSLLGALQQHQQKGTMNRQVGEADEEDGAKIVKHILGENSEQVVKALAADTDMNAEQVNRSLASLAPALLSGLSAATSSAQQSGGFDFTDLLGMFMGGGQPQQSSAMGILGSLLGGGAQQQSGGLLGSLLGGGAPQPQQQSGGLLGGLFGGGAPQPQQQSGGLLDSLFGGGAPQPQQQSGGLLDSLFGGGQPQQQATGLGGLLGGLFGGGQQQSTSAFDGGDLLSILMKLL